MNNFDYIFYTNLYDDLSHMNKEQAYQHYIKHGKKEKRVCNNDMMKEFQSKTQKEIVKQKQTVNENVLNKKENKINILIRTSNRPEYFENCIKSIFNQNYINFEILICYDKDESINYLKNYDDYDNVQYFPVYSTSNERYKYNLYCNELLKKVKEGYIIFLDDDDKFCHNDCLKIINNYIDKNLLVIWKYFRPDKIIYPKNEKTITLGEIASSSFILHKDMTINCFWWDKRNGDFHFISEVYKKNKVKFKMIPLVLTMAQLQQKISSHGK